MANCLFGFPLYSDPGFVYSPSVSGGSWSPTLPVTNIQDRRLSRVARSLNTLSTSTVFTLDLGVSRLSGLAALLLPNITRTGSATVRWIASDRADFAALTYDSGAVAAWPSGLSSEDAAGMNVWTTTIPPTAVQARYWRCFLLDLTNVDGYVDVARALVAGAYVPSQNMSLGARSGIEADTIRITTDGGAAIYNPKPNRRVETLSLDDLPQAEILGNIRRMQRQLGLSGQLFFIFDPADTTTRHDRAYLCVLKELSPLEYPVGLYMNAPISLLEEL